MRPITPSKNHDAIRIRFTYQGRRYSLGCGDWYSSADRADALATAAKIQADIRARTFDPTLERYRPGQQGVPLVSKPLTPLEAFELWLTQAGHSETTQHHTDRYVRAILIGDIDINAATSSTTFNRRLRTIQRALTWAKSEGVSVAANGWLGISARKHRTKAIRPFNGDELRRVVSAVSEVNDHYTGFTRFLIISGCRFGEVAGLMPDMVNGNSITIARTYSRGDDGGPFRLKEATKTGSVRVLRSAQLVSLLPEHTTSGPCFTSVNGCFVNHSYYRAHVWKPALSLVGLEYRKLHTLRHSTLSLALESGLSVAQVSGMAGHVDSSMVVKTYSHIINQVGVPELEI